MFEIFSDYCCVVHRYLLWSTWWNYFELKKSIPNSVQQTINKRKENESNCKKKYKKEDYSTKIDEPTTSAMPQQFKYLLQLKKQQPQKQNWMVFLKGTFSNRELVTNDERLDTSNVINPTTIPFTDLQNEKGISIILDWRHCRRWNFTRVIYEEMALWLYTRSRTKHGHMLKVT